MNILTYTSAHCQESSLLTMNKKPGCWLKAKESGLRHIFEEVIQRSLALTGPVELHSHLPTPARISNTLA
jgi:hypothetical protein